MDIYTPVLVFELNRFAVADVAFGENDRVRFDRRFLADLGAAHDARLQADGRSATDGDWGDDQVTFLAVVSEDRGAAADRDVVLKGDQARIGNIRRIDHYAFADLHAHHPIE